MIKILAKIKLYEGKNKRQQPFKNNYRPLFDNLSKVDTKLSGMISLLNQELFFPGDEGIVEISFLEIECIKNKKIYFYESNEPLGEGVILDCL